MDVGTLEEAKALLREHFDEGMDCPCCGQFVKKYRYKLFATSARALIDLYHLTNKTGETYHHVSKFAEARLGQARASHFAELRFWGLAAPMDKKTATQNSKGMWRITRYGRMFVEGEMSVRQFVSVFNNGFMGFDGDQVNIHEALGNKFDYKELMETE